MKATIRCIYDEGAEVGTSFIGAKGFSLLVDADGKRMLFDVGRRGRYLMHNLSQADVEPDSVDLIAISCGQKDHTGGLAGFLRERAAPIDIYAPASAKGMKSMLGTKGMHIPEEGAGKAVLHEVNGWVKITDHVHMSPPLASGGSDECFLVVDAAKGPAVLSARSGFGVENAVAEVRGRFDNSPITYVGGAFIGKRDNAKADAVAKAFSDAACTDLHLNHCTGVQGMSMLRAILGLDGVKDFYAGASIELDL
ncbi:MAG: MBL fold metallo-hydrolase [Candidatus Methanoplasma sp.]|jgi:7,8-dihydropterin-6-yl-methyl-4-(beta-D-ribofuranosyl)aminobenzene 5'-phosphate synthase|nr:MBL fold metallo-hydrolase [Candidatus Methanoplasma sp.]